ncbi:MAG: DUF7305 domain-containing protein [Candidatus Methylomirabilis sp.]
MKMKNGRGQEGIALVITLLVMTILLIMASAFMSISSTETLIAINERNRVQAYHLAEAGAERAIAQLNANSNYAGTGEQPLGPGAYAVAVTCVPPAAPAPPCPLATPDQRLISATGCVRNCTPPSATSRVEVRVQRDSGGSAFQFALLGVGPVPAGSIPFELDNNVQMDSYDSALGPYDPFNPGTQANVHSNGNIALGAGSTVQGSGRAVGSVAGGAGFTGGYTQGVPSQSVVMNTNCPAPGGAVTGVSPPGAYNTSTYDLTVAAGETVILAPGTYVFNRVTVDGLNALGTTAKLAITGPVIICMSGMFDAKSGSVVNTSMNPANLFISSTYAGSDATGENAIRMDGTGQFYGAIYVPNGEVEARNAANIVNTWQIFGAVIAKRLDFWNHVRFHYDLALARSSSFSFTSSISPGSGTPPPPGKFRPMAGSWQERL